jgi:hypothetical protein
MDGEPAAVGVHAARGGAPALYARLRSYIIDTTTDGLTNAWGNLVSGSYKYSGA